MNEIRWVYVRRPDREGIYRVRCIGAKGEAPLPDGGTLAYQMRRGNRIELRMNGALELRSFLQGELFVRRYGGNFRGPLFCFALSVLFFFSAGRMLSRFHSKPEPLAPPPVVADPPAPAPPPVRTEEKRPARKHDRGVRWAEAEREIRRAFIRGNLDRASELLDEARSENRGHTPRALRPLFAEVRYAGCRRAYDRGQWASAVRACESAIQESSHREAKGILKKLAAQARRFYLEGYVMENTDPSAAIRRYRETAAAAPTGNPYGKKALAKLQLIKRAGMDYIPRGPDDPPSR